MIEIKKVSSERWKDYRDLRFEALEQDPTAFCGTVEEESKNKPSEWQEWMNNCLFAVSDNELVGMISITFQKRKKLRHIANIVSFYVTPKHRQKGIGDKLIKESILIIKKNKDIRKIDLSVNPLHESAHKLYLKNGFKPIGTLKEDICVDGKYYDELMMEKHL